jgi:4'-phosphopantetheinyl transferase EntD
MPYGPHRTRHRPQRRTALAGGFSGSITHSGTQAMAVTHDHPALIGIDCEAILPENEAREIKDGIIDAQEEMSFPARVTRLPSP